MANDLLTQPGTRSGIKNKRTLTMMEVSERALRGGITPLEYLLKVLRRPELARRVGEDDAAFDVRKIEDVQLRLEAARIAAPYCHPKVATTINFGAADPADETKPIDILDLAKKVAFVFALAEHRPIDAPPPMKQIN